MATKSRAVVREAVHGRIRRKVAGTPERPRLSVYRSLKHISAQLVDDANGVTIAAASTVEKPMRGSVGGNIAAAKEVGRIIAERAREKGIEQVVFDRGGYIYHGRVKGLAEAAREAGLKF